MASKRDQIKLTPDELAAFLEAGRIVNVATFGPRGWPHLTALWYVLRDGEVWIYTYAKSQKVRNLERDPRATLLVEAGFEYQELKGAMIETEGEVHRDFETVFAVAEQLTLRYTEGLSAVEGAGRETLMEQARKRVAVRFRTRRVVSWDHSKLGGGY